MNSHIERIKHIAKADGRYSPDAFLFVSDGIQQTVKWLRAGEIKPEDVGPGRGEGEEFHVSGQELLVGLRRIAKERWGMMAKRVLNGWGIKSTEDFGEIVFIMVEDPELQWRKRECDTRDDFAGGFDFETAFDGWD
ncbi:MAG: hypothetical protein JXR97_00490 [Planctomycetes bacterium]|nr:hypothetical protein [Planctomycetota bacterium]